MRYAPEHKAETHRKIVKDAARRVRREGLNGAAVAAVMRDTGLTHGGFYKHFESKDELLLASIREAFHDTAEHLARAAEHAPPGTGWKAIVKTYLSVEHCDHAERGCPLAALGSEMARADRAMKGPIQEELKNYRRRLLPFMPGRSAAEKERAYFSIFSTMIGAVAVARMIPEPSRRARVLTTARDFLLRSF